MSGPAQPATVRESLGRAEAVLAGAGVDSPRLDTQLLLAWAMGVRREDLHREPERALDHRSRLIFEKAVELRAQRRPLPYITGEQWFYGRPFKVNRAVLIPRPETEMLVDFAIRCARQPDARIADICTGSGCVGVSVAAELPEAHVWASDISPLALHIARKNAVRHGVSERLVIAEGDLFSPLAGLTFDVIVANPPYITIGESGTLMPEVRDYEPPLALWGGGEVDTGADGTAVHRRLLSDARAALAPRGWVGVEAGAGQAQAIAGFAAGLGYGEVSVIDDLAGIGRVVAAQWPGEGQV